MLPNATKAIQSPIIAPLRCSASLSSAVLSNTSLVGVKSNLTAIASSASFCVKKNKSASTLSCSSTYEVYRTKQNILRTHVSSVTESTGKHNFDHLR